MGTGRAVKAEFFPLKRGLKPRMNTNVSYVINTWTLHNPQCTQQRSLYINLAHDHWEIISKNYSLFKIADVSFQPLFPEIYQC